MRPAAHGPQRLRRRSRYGEQFAKGGWRRPPAQQNVFLDASRLRWISGRWKTLRSFFEQKDKWLAGYKVPPASKIASPKCSAPIDYWCVAQTLRLRSEYELADRWQVSLAVMARGAHENRSAVSDRNGRDASCDEGTYQPYNKNDNPDCALCIDLNHGSCSFGSLGGNLFSLLGRPLQVPF